MKVMIKIIRHVSLNLNLIMFWSLFWLVLGCAAGRSVGQPTCGKVWPMDFCRFFSYTWSLCCLWCFDSGFFDL